MTIPRLIKAAILIIILLISSCNAVDDDGNSNNNSDLIIGLWEYSTQFLNGLETTVNDCQLSTIEFTALGERTDLYYDNNSGSCIVVDTVTMTWERLSNGTYQFTQNGFTFSEMVNFTNDDNTLSLESSDSDGNGGTNVHRFVYVRVN